MLMQSANSLNTKKKKANLITMHRCNPATNKYLLHSPFVCVIVLESVRVQRGVIFRLVSQELIVKETHKERKQNKAINTQYFNSVI